MQFDEVADSRHGFRVGTHVPGIQAIAPGDVGESVAVDVAQVQRLVDVDGAGQEPRAQAGHAKAGSFFFREDRDGQRTLRLDASRGKNVDGGECGRDAKRPVKGAPPGTESRWLPVTSAPSWGFPHQAR